MPPCQKRVGYGWRIAGAAGGLTWRSPLRHGARSLKMKAQKLGEMKARNPRDLKALSPKKVERSKAQEKRVLSLKKGAWG